MKSFLFLLLLSATSSAEPIPPLKEGALLALDENWSNGIDAEKWYVMRRHWGKGHHGVVPENVKVVQESDGKGGTRSVLVCKAHGDQYEGPVRGQKNRGDRVGGVIATKDFFASGRFEISMRVGSTEKVDGGPADPTKPIGAIPAIWTYAGWTTRVKPEDAKTFSKENPLYQPGLQEWGTGSAFYTSEIDFPELGKKGDFSKGLYNTYMAGKADYQSFAVEIADGQFHTYTTEWRTHLVEIKDLRDDQVLEHAGYFWIRDLKIPFELYLGNPVQKLGPNRYAICQGLHAKHWVDGKFVGENTKYVPSIAAQLSLGVWLPNWGGPAPWQESSVTFGRLRIWQYNDEGDVTGILKNDQPNNIGKRASSSKPAED
ncbi:glycoside hydrolase family 16 protein [Verrucomicrobiaceae bacterium 227]